jgi:hypothetical protein
MVLRIGSLGCVGVLLFARRAAFSCDPKTRSDSEHIKWSPSRSSPRKQSRNDGRTDGRTNSSLYTQLTMGQGPPKEAPPTEEPVDEGGFIEEGDAAQEPAPAPPKPAAKTAPAPERRLCTSWFLPPEPPEEDDGAELKVTLTDACRQGFASEVKVTSGRSPERRGQCACLTVARARGTDSGCSVRARTCGSRMRGATRRSSSPRGPASSTSSTYS